MGSRAAAGGDESRGDFFIPLLSSQWGDMMCRGLGCRVKPQQQNHGSTGPGCPQPQGSSSGPSTQLVRHREASQNLLVLLYGADPPPRGKENHMDASVWDKMDETHEHVVVDEQVPSTYLLIP